MKKYRCKVYWEMCGEVEVVANSPLDASFKAQNASLSSISDHSYVPDSANCDDEQDVILLDNNNGYHGHGCKCLACKNM